MLDRLQAPERVCELTTRGRGVPGLVSSALMLVLLVGCAMPPNAVSPQTASGHAAQAEVERDFVTAALLMQQGQMAATVKQAASPFPNWLNCTD